MPLFISGLELVILSQLPPRQANFFLENVPEENFMEIETGSEKLTHCLNYDEYINWFSLFESQNYDQYFESQF